jgi:hypothetical protein
VGTRIWGRLPSPQADMDRPCDAGRTWTPGTSSNDNDNNSSSATCLQRWIQKQMLHMAMHVVVQAFGFLCVLQQFGRDAMGEPAINRLGSAPRSGMGSGEQSAAACGRGRRGCKTGIDTKQRPPLPARALIVSV